MPCWSDLLIAAIVEALHEMFTAESPSRNFDLHCIVHEITVHTFFLFWNFATSADNSRFPSVKSRIHCIILLVNESLDLTRMCILSVFLSVILFFVFLRVLVKHAFIMTNYCLYLFEFQRVALSRCDGNLNSFFNETINFEIQKFILFYQLCEQLNCITIHKEFDDFNYQMIQLTIVNVYKVN